MKESWLAQNPNGVGELSFLFCGRQNCAPGDSVGPAVREHYLLHFCLSGRGVYQAQGRSYAIGPGEGFLILPDEVTSYQADQRRTRTSPGPTSGWAFMVPGRESIYTSAAWGGTTGSTAAPRRTGWTTASGR